MAVNIRRIYKGKEEVSKKNKPYRYQLDFYTNSKRVRETIKGLTRSKLVIVNNTDNGLFVELI